MRQRFSIVDSLSVFDIKNGRYLLRDQDSSNYEVSLIKKPYIIYHANNTIYILDLSTLSTDSIPGFSSAGILEGSNYLLCDKQDSTMLVDLANLKKVKTLPQKGINYLADRYGNVYLLHRNGDAIDVKEMNSGKVLVTIPVDGKNLDNDFFWLSDFMITGAGTSKNRFLEGSQGQISYAIPLHPAARTFQYLDSVFLPLSKEELKKYGLDKYQ